jgi:uncharacterized iron-regulated membrane protein
MTRGVGQPNGSTAASWLRRPQSVWLRRALFQIHLWTGIGLGLYIFVISISGSAIVFRSQLAEAFQAKPVPVTVSRTRLTDDELERAARREYPGYDVQRIWPAKTADIAVEVWLERGSTRKQRLFDPYSGKDLAASLPLGFRILNWLVDLHDNLLGGPTGRFVNGLGGILLTVMCLTGAVIWWRGSSMWWRGLIVRWNVNAKRFNFDLHSALGFWFFALILMWAVTSIYLVFPGPFLDLVDYLEPAPNPTTFEEAIRPGRRPGDIVLQWFTRLHFGRWADPRVSAVWVVLGLVPSVLFITGAIMWWNRVVRKFEP